MISTAGRNREAINRNPMNKLTYLFPINPYLSGILDMKNKQLVALLLLGLAFANTANAGQVPTTISKIDGVSTIPLDLDWRFSDRGLTVSVSGNGNGGYQLTAIGTGNVTLNGPSPDNAAYAGTLTGTGYSLTANFDSNSKFVSTGSLFTITGTLASAPVGSTGTPTGTLYSANLTSFGTDANQAAIAFNSVFNTSWSNQQMFTGGSKGEVVYLFDQVGLETGYGRLSSLISALGTNNLSALVGKSYTAIESIATIPLPLPIVLFGTGLAALLGLGRKRRASAQSI